MPILGRRSMTGLAAGRPPQACHQTTADPSNDTRDQRDIPQQFLAPRARRIVAKDRPLPLALRTSGYQRPVHALTAARPTTRQLVANQRRPAAVAFLTLCMGADSGTDRSRHALTIDSAHRGARHPATHPAIGFRLSPYEPEMTRSTRPSAATLTRTGLRCCAAAALPPRRVRSRFASA